MTQNKVRPRLSLTLVESAHRTSGGQALGAALGVGLHIGIVSAAVVAFSSVPLVAEQPLTDRPTFLAPLLQERPRPVQEQLTYSALGGETAREPEPTIGVITDAGPTRNLALDEAAGAGDGQDASDAHIEEPPRTFSEVEVDSAAVRDPESAGPEYPLLLMNKGIEGSVLVRFVVDSNGRPDVGTFLPLEYSDTLFSQSVRAALPRMKFKPGRRGNVPVRQLVEIRFSFKVEVRPPADSGSGKSAKPPQKPPLSGKLV